MSMSKRIMAEYTCLALDLFPGCIYTTDTDSTHIPREYIAPIAAAFKKEYGRELIGKGLGQFHVDFEMDGCTDVHSTEGVFLGKKAYCDVLQGTDEDTGEIRAGIHFRMKGVPQRSVLAYCDDHHLTVIELYHQMYKGKAITFDLLAGGGCSFQSMKDGTVRSRRQFFRTVRF